MNPLKPLALLVCAGALSAQTPATAPAKPKPAATAPKPAAATPAKPAAPAKAAAAKPAAPKDGKVVLTVGDEKITDKEFDSFLDALPDQVRAQARAGMKRQIAEQIVRVKLLAQEARRRGIDKDPQFVAKANFQMENMLAGALYNDMQSSTKLDESAEKAYYEQHKSEGEEASARHILIRFKGSPAPGKEGAKELTEEEALAKIQAIRKRIVGGEDFAKVAMEESEDQGSGKQGGDLGTFKHGMMVPQFDQAAFSLPVGQVSEPIKTQFGYHLIKVDKRGAKTFEEMRPEIEKKMKPEAATKAVEDIRAKATVKFDDGYFDPPAPAAPKTPEVK